MSVLSVAKRFILRAGSDAPDELRELSRALDEAVGTLRWCKKHPQDARTSSSLKFVQLNLSQIALALDLQMDGDTARARSAVCQILWRPQDGLETFQLERPEVGC